MKEEAVASFGRQGHKNITEITLISLLGEEEEIGFLLLFVKKKREYTCHVVYSDKTRQVL
jgi:hypothetical protein